MTAAPDLERLRTLEAQRNLAAYRIDELKRDFSRADRRATLARKKADALQADLRLIIDFRDRLEDEMTELRRGAR